MYLCRYIYTLTVGHVKCKHGRYDLDKICRLGICFAEVGFVMLDFVALLRSKTIVATHNIANIQQRLVKLETMAS
jgi:hypothetical protein